MRFSTVTVVERAFTNTSENVFAPKLLVRGFATLLNRGRILNCNGLLQFWIVWGIL